MIGRRRFLNCALLAMPTAAARPPRLEDLVDVHVHLWTNEFDKYPLAPNFKSTDMLRPAYLPQDLLPGAVKSGVSRIVLVQMSYYGFDNSYMLDVIRNQPRTFRGIAVVDSGSADLEANMKRLATAGVRGFRIRTGGPNDGWAEQPGLHSMFGHASRLGLAMCPLINPESLPQLDRLCQRFPDTPVIIDHLARIGTSGTIQDSDVKALCGLARHANTKVKVSAFYALGSKRPPHLDLAPLIKRVHEAFGPKRLMWGSDCPFQTQDETYEDSVSLIRDRLDFLSAEDKEWILRRTAEQFFFAGPAISPAPP